jgi:ubiquitin-like-conjugating enzyme ATG3
MFSWEGGLDKNKNKNLPDDKQYLITRNMPCQRRIKDLKGEEAKEEELEDGWVSTDNPSGSQSKASEAVDIDDIDNVIDDKEEEEEAMDIDEI